jgi:predicted CXXCH cytochrome family protein
MKREVSSITSLLGGTIVLLVVLLVAVAGFATEGDYMDNYIGADADMVGTDNCAMCHSDLAEEEDTHVAKVSDDDNGCEGCHGPGSAHNGNVLGILNPSKMPQEETTATCTSCHEEQGAFTLEDWEESAHNEAGNSCVDCHLGHTSNPYFLITEEVNDLCNDCHEDIVVAVEAGEHGVEGMACTACHNLHGG